ncbi:MAG: chorismate synthase [Actinobacteria bacterium]|nr:chorismate synthase [Actinomycetota bacterium]
MGNSFGSLFRVTSFGESHGGAVGVIVDGCPSNIDIDLDAVQHELTRRRPGQSHITTPRKEPDQLEVLSGIFKGKTLGTPIAMMVRNQDANPKAYDHLKAVFRPSHADYTYQEKFGIRNWQGGGRSSARETIARVAAGAIAKQVLTQIAPIEILAYVIQIHQIRAHVDSDAVQAADIEANIVRCPDPAIAKEMITRIEVARKEGDSVGGVIACVCRGVPAGWGEPVFDKIKADLSKAMMSLPASMGIEMGSGFAGVEMTGKAHNDAFYMDDDGQVRTKTNFSGGTQGGITNGEPILFRTAFKPTATIFSTQDTVTEDKKNTTLAAKGRHDPCVLPRAVPIVEAMAALVLLDHALRHQARKGGS